jgi:hypothetical protein
VAPANIDYYLSNASPDLKLEILDASGSTVRTFAAGAPESRALPADDETPPPPVRSVPALKGLNRFVWDMRAAPSHDFPGLIMYQASVAGPFVPPDRYTVKLTGAGVTLSSDFAITRDPRLSGVTDADLREQFRFAREIQDKFSRTNDTVARIRRIKTEIAERMERAKSDPITSAGNKLAAELTEVEGRLYQYRNRATKDPLNFPPQLNNKLGSLLAVVESAAARPTDSSYEVVKELSTGLDRQLSELADLLGRDLTAFNKALEGLHLVPVTQ